MSFNQSAADLDDAIHVRNIINVNQTLCGEAAWKVLNVVAFSDPPPDGASGCWECLRIRHNYSMALGGGA